MIIHSTYGVKFIGIPVLVASCVVMEAKAKTNVKSLDIDITLFLNPSKLDKVLIPYLL